MSAHTSQDMPQIPASLLSENSAAHIHAIHLGYTSNGYYYCPPEDAVHAGVVKIDRIKRVGILEDIENETDMVVNDIKEYFGVK